MDLASALKILEKPGCLKALFLFYPLSFSIYNKHFSTIMINYYCKYHSVQLSYWKVWNSGLPQQLGHWVLNLSSKQGTYHSSSSTNCWFTSLFFSYQRADPNFVMLTPSKEHLAEGIVWKIGKRPMLQSDINAGNFDGIPKELRPLNKILWSSIFYLTQKQTLLLILKNRDDAFVILD